MLNNIPSPKSSSIDTNFHAISPRNKVSKYNKTSRTKIYQEEQNENKDSSTGQLLLLDVAREFLAYKKEEIGREIRKTTFRTYEIRFKNLEDYLKKTKRTDIPIQDVNTNVTNSFVRYLLYRRKVSHDHVRRVITQLKQVIDYAQLCEYIETNKIKAYKLKRSPQKELIYLSEQELDRLMNYPIASPSLRKIADLFKLQCWTGLSYGDLMNFSISNIDKNSEGIDWICYYRVKHTPDHHNEVILPLLPEAEEIFERYNYQLPYYQNGLYNRFLKEIASITGISKHLTTHVGRKTFGMIMLNQGIPIEVVSRMLGHKSIRTTQEVYAKVLKGRIAREMKMFFEDMEGPFKPRKTTKLIILR